MLLHSVQKKCALMKPDYFLGIDTSNYTTSAAIVDAEGRVVANCKCPLPVAAGACGLRQSDAVFAHIKNMPSLMEMVRPYLEGGRLIAIGVSEAPRRAEGSYMPCFLSGVAAAEAAATAAGIPLYRFSHQCGHLAAALLSSEREDLFDTPFAAFHVSGGTTELVCVKGFSPDGFSVELLGGTADLNAGQVIDRVGVMLGLRFPCGPLLETLAEKAECVPRPRVSVKGFRANLSGVENQAKKMLSDGVAPAVIAAYVLDFVAETLAALSGELRNTHGPIPIVYAGGVMCNKRIRARLSSFRDTAFAEPAFSADNAAGIALLCKKRHGGSYANRI